MDKTFEKLANELAEELAEEFSNFFTGERRKTMAKKRRLAMSKTPEQMAEEYADDWHKDCDYPEPLLVTARKATKTIFLAGYHTAYNMAYELGFEEALKAQRILTSIQEKLKKTNENA